MRFIFVASLLFALASQAQDHIVWRGGCPNAFARFTKSQETKEYTKIRFIGGSITEGGGANGYRALTMKRLREDFAGATLAENNAAIGGTGSWLGAFRTGSDIYDADAALVFVEFAVNDGGGQEEDVIASMEGIVRRIWSRRDTADIVFLYTIAKNHLDSYKDGKLPPTVQFHEKVAERYGITSVNMGAFVAKKTLAGELPFEDFAADGVHPTEKGYALYMEALAPFFEKGKSEWAGLEPAKHEWRNTASLSPAPMEKAICMPYEWAKADAGWTFGQQSASERFYHVAVCDTPGAELAFTFKGSQVGVFTLIGPDSGNIEYAIDGGGWQLLKDFDRYCVNSTRPHARPLAKGLDPAQEHAVKLRVAEAIPEQSKGRTVRLGFLLVDGDAPNPYARADKLEQIDALYAAMKPHTFAPLPDRWKNLDKTRQRLADGGDLKIVMLGDSIIGDTYSSHYWLTWQRMYPKCKITPQLSNRGSTGCRWYKEENRVEPYVLQYNPDLLIIGGISQSDDTEAIRAVIRQVREKQNPDILLLTQVFGATRDKHISQWTFDPAPDTYRARLRQLADEEKCGFFDMTGIWWQYILDSGTCYGWFMRDYVHANERGFQTIGRMLEINYRP
ncbi:MAG: GDSL-type esterase/lipase family protein [Kiritimatiellaeota bacterium]|nr:GDSL-type esterase/lipase family protein [Kiritimatiellota bacterium]